MKYLFATALATTLVSVVASAQSTETAATEPSRVENALRRLEHEVADLRLFLHMVIPSPIQEITPVEVNVEHAPSKGNGTTYVIIEFGDFQCPYCGQYARTTYRDVLVKLVETGKVKYVFKHLPLESLHQNAFKAAEAAQCAAEQDRFWEMHDQLYANQQALNVSELLNHASRLHLDEPAFKACLEQSQTAPRVRSDVAVANRLGITGTPTFLIGELRGETAVVTRRIAGAQQFGVFQAAIEGLIGS
jgi:protein-disulfide isomerase